MKVPLLLLLLSVIFMCCSPKGNAVLDEPAPASENQAAVVERLYQQKALIDTLFNKQIDKVTVLVKLPGNNLVEVIDEAWPDAIETTYNILKDTEGNICRISESPYSESGDWDIVYTHYFDKVGNTFAYERVVSAFNTFCPEDEYVEGVTREVLVKVYNPSLTLIDSTYRMVDEKSKDITKKKCQQEVESDAHVFNSLQEYLEKNEISIK